MIDINAIINAIVNNDIQEAIDNAVRPLAQRIAELETKLTEAALFQKETNVTVDMDALRHLVKPMIDSVVEQAIADHCEEYDHDEYDSAVNKVDDMPDFDDFVRSGELEDSVKEAVSNLTFDISVS